MNTYKVSDLIEAIKKNQIPWIKHAWFEQANGKRPILMEEDTEVVARACVLGIGVINLGVYPLVDHFDIKGWNFTKISPVLHTAIRKIMEFNDSYATESWEEARDFAIETLTPLADEEFQSEPREYQIEKVGEKS